jgi:hypothetical protein
VRPNGTEVYDLAPTPASPEVEKAMRKIQWNIDFHNKQIAKYEAAKVFLSEHPEMAEQIATMVSA